MFKRRRSGVMHGLAFSAAVLAPAVVTVQATCVSGGCASAPESSIQAGLSTAIERADRYYAERANPQNVRDAVAILRAQVAEHPEAYDAWWRIAKYECYLARQLPDKQEIPVLEDGVKAGKTAESIEPGRPEGHFWTGANEGLLAEERGFLAGLRLVDPIRIEMQTVIKLDPDYQQDGAERILGRLYYEAPFFKGGDKKLSVRLLEGCLKRYPKNSLTMLYLADSYRATGRRAEARDMLERVLRLGPDPEYGPELAQNRAQAELQLQKYFHASR